MEIKRRDIQKVVDAALNHAANLRLANLDIASANELVEAILDLPCFYCDGTTLSHTDSCDRNFWRPKPTWEELYEFYEERILDDTGDSG